VTATGVVPALVVRLIPTVICCDVGVVAPATTPRVTRRSFEPLPAAELIQANPVSTASAAEDLIWKPYRDMRAPFRA
jgi:hypothetical protein